MCLAHCSCCWAPSACHWLRFTEDVTPDFATRASLKSLTLDTQSEFQRVQIIETGPFGKTLVLDGKTQSALFDEYVYHESLVQPVMLAHHNPKTVYVGGGGEFGTTREILRHKSVEKVVMVDIDKVVSWLRRTRVAMIVMWWLWCAHTCDGHAHTRTRGTRLLMMKK